MTEDPRIRDRIRAVLSDPMLDEAAMLDQVNAILDSAPPAPRVWFPGETVPAGTPVVNHVGGIWKHHADRVVKTGWAVELQMPDETDLLAAVDRASDEREEALHSDRHAEITEAAASEARDG